MSYYLYFDGIDDSLLAASSADLQLVRECIFLRDTGQLKQYFEVDNREMYQDLIDYQFQEFILFSATILESLVYLSETLLKKVAIHLSKKHPPSIPMQNFIDLLEFLHKLEYRDRNDPLPICLQTHDDFLGKYLVNINILRNGYIHGYRTKLANKGGEYSILELEAPLSDRSPEASAKEFAKGIIDNLKIFIPDFLKAITDTINAKASLPA